MCKWSHSFERYCRCVRQLPNKIDQIDRHLRHGEREDTEKQEAVEQAHAEELAYEKKRFEFKSQLKPQERYCTCVRQLPDKIDQIDRHLRHGEREDTETTRGCRTSSC